MANKNIPDLIASEADLALTDLFEIYRSAVSANRKITGQQLKNLLDLSYIENDFDILAYQSFGSVIKGQTLFGNLAQATTSYTILDGNLRAMAGYLPKAATLTGLKFWQRIQGNFTADNNNRVGLYSVSGTTATLVAASSNDGSLWQSVANGILSVPFSSSYVAAKGNYYIVQLANWSAVTTSPTLAQHVSWLTNQATVDFTSSNKLNFSMTSQSDLPATIDLTAVTAQTTPIWSMMY